MTGVIQKFFVASMFMWIAPVVILCVFNNNWFPGMFLLIGFTFYRHAFPLIDLLFTHATDNLIKFLKF